MTGRHSFLNTERAKLRVLYPDQPHLATMFKRNGYRTGLVGKTAPIDDLFDSDDPEGMVNILSDIHFFSIFFIFLAQLGLQIN